MALPWVLACHLTCHLAPDHDLTCHLACHLCSLSRHWVCQGPFGTVFGMFLAGSQSIWKGKTIGFLVFLHFVS